MLSRYGAAYVLCSQRLLELKTALTQPLTTFIWTSVLLSERETSDSRGRGRGTEWTRSVITKMLPRRLRDFPWGARARSSDEQSFI